MDLDFIVIQVTGFLFIALFAAQGNKRKRFDECGHSDL